MTPPELLAFDSATALTSALARRWCDWVAAKPSGTRLTVALSGGRIMPQLYREMVRLSRSAGLTWKNVEFFWADERCVPPTDPESNYRPARETLFEPLAIPEAQIHRIHGELPPTQAARQADAELRAFLPQSSPVLDLVLLGMGEDGHTASLFPGDPAADAHNQAFYRPVVASKPPPNRITLDFHPLIYARAVWVLASGSGKEEALRDSLAPGDLTPLGRVLAARSSTLVCTDFPVPRH